MESLYYALYIMPYIIPMLGVKITHMNEASSFQQNKLHTVSPREVLCLSEM